MADNDRAGQRLVTRLIVEVGRGSSRCLISLASGSPPANRQARCMAHLPYQLIPPLIGGGFSGKSPVGEKMAEAARKAPAVQRKS